MRAVVTILLAFSTLTACSAMVPATCDAEGFIEPPRLSCDQAIAAARTQYATTPGIKDLVVQYGPICPPNARCLAPTDDLATVFANLLDGSQLYVTVSIGPDGSVQVDAPQPVPDFEP